MKTREAHPIFCSYFCCIKLVEQISSQQTYLVAVFSFASTHILLLVAFRSITKQ